MSSSDAVEQELLQRSASMTVQIMDDLHGQFKPHIGQITVGQSLFNQDKKLVFIECGRKWGKCLDLETPILTPNGFVRLADIRAGDVVFDENGHEQHVTGAYDPIHNKKLYRIHFCDGTHLDACHEHKWLTWTKLNRKSAARGGRQIPTIKTTQEIFETQIHGKEFNHSIPYCGPIQLSEKKLPLDPYLLGCWLGDGSSTKAEISGKDEAIFEAFRDAGFEQTYIQKGITRGFKGGLLATLKEMGLIKNKHVPNIYLMASIEQRLSLLQGLMDTDGTMEKEGRRANFYNTNKVIFDAALWLIRSLGMKPMVRIKKMAHKEHKDCYVASFFPTMPVFRLERKASRIRLARKTLHRTIVKVETIPSRPVRCISVSGPSKLYLAGESLVATHNTEFIIYTLYRWLLLNPNGVFYYIAPYLKQAKEIIWASRRLQNFLPPEIREQYILAPKEQELRIPARGGDGFIKLDGADNFEAYRGVNPDGLVYEEFKDHRPEFHRGMRANLATKMAPLVIIGTPPPDADNHFCELAEEAKHHPEGAYFNMPTWVNPHIDRKWLKQEKESLYRMGRPEEWELEYACRRVKGTRLHVFGVLDEAVHVQQHYKVMHQLRLNFAKNAQFYCVADPAGSSCFGVLFAAIDPYSRKVFLLDEMYVTDLRLMSSRKMWEGTFASEDIQEMEGIKEKLEELQPDMSRWTFIYDEAASWWRNEMDSEFGISWMPTHKHLNDKNHGLSLIKDQLVNKLVIISDRCQKLLWEMRNYIRDENGKVPKKNDHLIDCFRYLNGHEVMDTVGVPVPQKTLEQEKMEERRGFSSAEDIEREQEMQHWETDLVGDL